jgi:hypothetical protein
LKGLVSCSGFFLSGFVDNTVSFSEINQPHAWPSKYDLATDTDVVGLAPLEVGVVVATKNQPYLFRGTDPATLDPLKLPYDWPCVSAESVVSAAGRAYYASDKGLVGVSPSGECRMVTADTIEERKWRAMKPETMRCLADASFLYIFAEDQTMMLSLESSDPLVTFLDETCQGGLTYDGQMYLIQGASVVQLDSNGIPKEVYWRSGQVELPYPTSFSTARVTAYRYPMEFELWSEGEKVYQTSVRDNQAFRIPTLRPERRWQVAVQGYSQVSELLVSSGMLNLKTTMTYGS